MDASNPRMKSASRLSSSSEFSEGAEQAGDKNKNSAIKAEKMLLNFIFLPLKYL